MGKGTREDIESGYYIHGKPEYRGGLWGRCDVWHGKDGDSCKQHVCAKNGDDDSNIYWGAVVPTCPCCYLKLFHTEEYHNEHVNK